MNWILRFREEGIYGNGAIIDVRDSDGNCAQIFHDSCIETDDGDCVTFEIACNASDFYIRKDSQTWRKKYRPSERKSELLIINLL